MRLCINVLIIGAMDEDKPSIINRLSAVFGGSSFPQLKILIRSTT